jgi:folate-binding protein YgfZ
MASKSLRDWQSHQGARFEDLYSRQVPASYGDPRPEYDAVRSAVGILDVSYTGRLRVAGRDRVRYLHNMLTNDIRSLQPGTGCYAALLTHQGRMESDLFVYAGAEELWLECPPAGTDRLQATLRKFVVADQVEIEDVSAGTALLSVQGPGSAAILRGISGSGGLGSEPLAHCTVDGASGPWRLVRRDRTGAGGFDVWLPSDDAAVLWERWTADGGERPCGHSALNWLRTEAGIPWYGPDMDDTSLPMEFGLDSALNFKKGCYRGQEIVARVTFRGNLDRRLGGISVQSEVPPARGAEVRAEGNKVGSVTSSAPSPRLGCPLALSILKTACLTEGTIVEIDMNGKAVPGRIVSLPLRTQ